MAFDPQSEFSLSPPPVFGVEAIGEGLQETLGQRRPRRSPPIPQVPQEPPRVFTDPVTGRVYQIAADGSMSLLKSPGQSLAIGDLESARQTSMDLARTSLENVPASARLLEFGTFDTEEVAAQDQDSRVITDEQNRRELQLQLLRELSARGGPGGGAIVGEGVSHFIGRSGEFMRRDEGGVETGTGQFRTTREPRRGAAAPPPLSSALLSKQSVSNALFVTEDPREVRRILQQIFVAAQKNSVPDPFKANLVQELLKRARELESAVVKQEAGVAKQEAFDVKQEASAARDEEKRQRTAEKLKVTQAKQLLTESVKVLAAKKKELTEIEDEFLGTDRLIRSEPKDIPTTKDDNRIQFGLVGPEVKNIPEVAFSEQEESENKQIRAIKREIRSQEQTIEELRPLVFSEFEGDSAGDAQGIGGGADEEVQNLATVKALLEEDQMAPKDVAELLRSFSDLDDDQINRLIQAAQGAQGA